MSATHDDSNPNDRDTNDRDTNDRDDDNQIFRDDDRIDRIEIRELRVLGTHGVLPEERRRPQPFSVDIDIRADLRAAGRSDALADTIDYGRVAEAAAAEVAGPRADLLEHLAERIAQKVLGIAGGRATSVTVTLRKLRPPVSVNLSSAGVRITRP